MIYTFYSYKGGVGRSMALANVAQYLYSRGARVVMIDWDLEAPGLENFFASSQEQIEDIRSQLGLIDMLENYKRQFSHAYSVGGKDRTVFQQLKPQLLAIRDLLYPIHPPDPPGDPNSAALWLLPAGWRSTKAMKPGSQKTDSSPPPRKDDRFSKYAAAVQSFDWSDFYTNFEGPAYFDWFRDQLLPLPALSGSSSPLVPDRLGVDTVLIDSRTGVTEMGGICTRQLADVVVAFCAPNYQNLEGVASMAASFVRQEIILARGGRELEVLVIPARVDEQGATIEEAEFHRRFANRLKAPPTFQRNGLDMYSLLLPYIAKYSYSEILAVGVEESKLERAYKNLAAHLALFSGQESNLRRLFAAEIQQIARVTSPRVFLWSLEKDSATVAALSSQLDSGGVANALDEAQYLLAVLTSAALQSSALRKQIRLARQKGVIVYGMFTSTLPSPLPRYLRKVRLFNASGGLDGLINELRKPSQPTPVPFMAPRLVPDFVDRPDELNKIVTALLTPTREPNPVSVILCGAGGIGKSCLAARFCQDEDVMDAFDDGILWITLGESPDLLSIMSGLYLALTGTEPQFINLQSALAKALASKSCLVVLDDLRNPEQLAAFSFLSHCARLVTTRDSMVAPNFLTITLDVMTDEQAQQLLGFGPGTSYEGPALPALARRLGRWPLALALARTQIAQAVSRGESPEDAAEFLSRTFERKGLSALSDSAGSLDAAIRRTFDSAQQQLPDRERELYAQLAIFAPDSKIPMETVTAFWPHDALDTQDLLLRLDKLALLNVDLESRIVCLNPLIQSYLATTLTEAPALHSRLLNLWGDARHPPNPFAWRWIIYHMVRAGRQQEARALLLDFDWINAKAAATDVACLASDYDLFPGDQTLRAVAEALTMPYTMPDLRVREDADGETPSTRLVMGLSQSPEPEAVALFKKSRQWRVIHRVHSFKAHSGCVRAVVLERGRLISASDDETIKEWDRNTFELILKIHGHSRPVNAIALIGDGVQGISASNDCTLKLWDLNTGILVRTYSGQSTWALSVAIESVGRVVSGFANGAVLEWELTSGKQVRLLLGHSNWVTAISWISQRAQVISASGDGTLRIWSLDDGGAEIATLRGHEDWVTALAVSADGRYAVSGSYDATLRLWHLVDEGPTAVMVGHTAPVNAVAIISDLNRSISVSADKTIRVWDLDTFKELGSIMGDQELVSCSVAPDNRTILCGDISGGVHLFRSEG